MLRRHPFRALAGGALLAGLVLPATLSVTPAAALPRPGEAWLQVQSPHFLVFSQAGEKAARQAAQDLERLRDALAQLNPELRLTSPVPTWIYLFKNAASFEPYRRFHDGRPLEGAGYFASHPFGNYMAIGADPGGETRRVVQHEYLHHVLAENYPGLPTWLDEGLAEYFSTFDVVNGVAKLGGPIASHVLWLRQNALIPLPELLAVDQGSPVYNEGSRRGVFYAQSWALVHFLLNGDPERRRQIQTCLHDLATQGTARPGACASFGDLGLLERDLRTSVQAAVFQEQRVAVAEAGEVALEIAPLSRAQILGRLGNLLLHNGDLTYTGAAEHFRAALAEAPGDATALAGLARIALDAGRRAEALSLFTQAAQAAPEDFFLHYLLGVSLLQPEPAPGDLPRAEAALRRAIALRPDFAEGWGRLAEALTYEETLPADAARIFETAWRMMPSRLDFAFNLTLFYARTGATDRAQEMIERVLVPHQERPDLALKAREAVFLGRWEVIEHDLVRPGKLEEAAPRLADLLAQAPTPQRRADLQKRLDEIRDTLDYNGFSDRYNRAVDFLNAGKDDDAIRLLEELAATTKNPGQAAQARELLDRVLDGPRRRP